MVKDRMEEFRNRSKEYSKVPMKEKSSKKKPQEDGGIQNFLHTVEGIETELQSLRTKVDTLIKLQLDICNKPLGYKNVNKYESLVQEINGDSTKLRKSLRQIEGELKENPKQEESTLNRIQNQQVNRLSNTLATITNDFFMAQSNYMDKMKANLRKQFIVTNNGMDNMTNSELNEILDSDTNYAAFTQNYKTDCDMAEQQLRLIEERDQDIKALESKISKVNSLFVDMSVLVQEQGEVINNIDKQVTTATVDVEHGKVQLESAEKKAKRARKRCFCFVGIGVIAALIVIGIIVGIVMA